MNWTVFAHFIVSVFSDISPRKDYLKKRAILLFDKEKSHLFEAFSEEKLIQHTEIYILSCMSTYMQPSMRSPTLPTHTYSTQPTPPRRHGTSKSIYFAWGSEVLGGVGESSVVDAGGVTGRRRGAALCGISSGSLQQPRNELWTTRSRSETENHATEKMFNCATSLTPQDVGVKKQKTSLGKGSRIEATHSHS